MNAGSRIKIAGSRIYVKQPADISSCCLQQILCQTCCLTSILWSNSILNTSTCCLLDPIRQTACTTYLHAVYNGSYMPKMHTSNSLQIHLTSASCFNIDSDVALKHYFSNWSYTTYSNPTRQICSGRSVLNGILSNPRGHRLWVGDLGGGNRIVFCKCCWHYASAYPRSLRTDCLGPSAVVRPSVKFYLQRSRHPVYREVFTKPCRLNIGSVGTPSPSPPLSDST